MCSKLLAFPTNWIHEIFVSARLLALINGTPEGFFNCGTGVRQGDPLSPIIFCLAEDFLSCLINKKIGGKYCPNHSSRGGNIPTHLLFADDVLLFCRATNKNIKCLQDILSCYGKFLG